MTRTEKLLAELIALPSVNPAFLPPRHPHAGRFAEHEAEVTRILASPKDSDAELDAELQQRHSSLRVVVKEIPSVFGSFF